MKPSSILEARTARQVSALEHLGFTVTRDNGFVISAGPFDSMDDVLAHLKAHGWHVAPPSTPPSGAAV